MITATGGKQYQRDYAVSIAEFVCQKFNIEPTVEICLREMANDNNYGYCCDLEDNEYEIEVKRGMRLRTLLTTIAHEMIHVKQYVEGTLDHSAEADMDYWDRPSEIEAHGREIGIFIRWAEQQGLADRAWTQAERH